MTIICRVKGETILRLNHDFDGHDNNVFYYNDTTDDHKHPIDKHATHDHNRHHNEYQLNLNHVKQEVMNPFEDPFSDCQQLLDSFDKNYSLVSETKPKDEMNGSVGDSYHRYLKITKSNGRQVFACKWRNCSYSALWRNAIANHIRNHMKYFPFVCEFAGCDKSFAISSNLNNHRKVHSGRHKTLNDTKHELMEMNAIQDNCRQNGSQTQKRKTSGNMMRNRDTICPQKESFVDKRDTNYGLNKSKTKTKTQKTSLKSLKRNDIKVETTDERSAEGVAKPSFVGIKSVEQYFTVSQRDGKTWRKCVFCDYVTPYPTSIIYHMRSQHFDDKNFVYI
ncbi:unnamed protein product [Oppiella nova]|uniref:C2H2-type domain-containing protein n=1 Tax=Oppiella nova TaxID=334625 RepID=A0A7R9LIK6_9ACAR|nr:unnamed protein product [Oppiella nova]CAG2164018.1 unnamed protein product [Oppiella nova]